MSRRSVPRIAPNDLRDHADEARIARVWDRIEGNLSNTREAAPHRAGLVIALVAATMAAFSGGLLVGRSMWREAPSAPLAAVPSSDRTELYDVIAAGSQPRTVGLPGGGEITLSPETTVEVERTSGGALTLRLVRGEAAVSTTEIAAAQNLAIVAGAARLSAGTGSVVRVRRNQDDMDVAVSDGSVRIISPAGSQELARGQEPVTVPIRTTSTTSQVDDSVRPRLAIRPSRSSQDPRSDAPDVAAPAPDWLTRAKANDSAGALALLRQQPGGIAGAIASAKTAGELMVLSDLARSKGGDPSLAQSALTRVVDGFPDDPNASIAAYTLGRLYDKAGQPQLAQTYYEKSLRLKPEGALAEDALCKQVQAEHRAAHKDEAVRIGKEYLSKYPDGRCKEEVERIISGDDVAESDDATAPSSAPASSPSASPGDPPKSPAAAPSASPSAHPSSQPSAQPAQSSQPAAPPKH